MSAKATPTAGRFVGQPVRRREDERILRGNSRYIDDIEPAGAAHVAFVRSPFASAEIRGITKPDPADGLIAVITAADIAGVAKPLAIQAILDSELADEPHPILASDEVRYAGQPVALVLAESRALAEDFAELVDVDYELRDAVVDLRTSPIELARTHVSGGDVEGAFAAAAHVVRASHVIPRVAPAPMEGRGAIATYAEAVDKLTVHVSAQDTHRQLEGLADCLDRPEESIHVVVADTGGGFGAKGSVAPETAAVAAAAILNPGLTVKWAEDRSENFLTTYQGRGMEADVELALDGDGRMLGIRATVYADCGGYLMPTTAIPIYTVAMLITGAYTIPAAEVTVIGNYTNKVPTGPYRGAGRPEATHLLECTVDVAAHQLGIDPVELRRRNLVREFPYLTPLGWSWDSGDYERCMDMALELVAADAGGGGDDVLVGTGVCTYVERAGGLWETAEAALQPTGRIEVRSGSSPHGQGHDTTFAQIAAERLGVGLEDVEMRFNDSQVVPRGVGTFASRSIAMGGSAMVLALDELKARCVEVAARMLELPADELSWSDGAVVASDGRRVWLRDIAAAEPGIETYHRFESDQTFSSGTYAAVVEIERATGRMKIRRMACVDDAGTIINPLLADGQVIGGVAQGLGASLVEEAVYDEDGNPSFASFAGYSLMTAAEMPPLDTAFVESPSPINPLGAKGIGEAGTVGVPPAVSNAIAAALGGRRIDPPFTPDKIWRALQEDAS